MTMLSPSLNTMPFHGSNHILKRIMFFVLENDAYPGKNTAVKNSRLNFSERLVFNNHPRKIDD